jgi:hypothetical protein
MAKGAIKTSIIEKPRPRSIKHITEGFKVSVQMDPSSEAGAFAAARLRFINSLTWRKRENLITSRYSSLEVFQRSMTELSIGASLDLYFSYSTFK